MIRIFDESLEGLKNEIIELYEKVLESWKNEIRSMYEKFDKPYKVILWGTGDWGHQLYDLLISTNIEIFAYCDNNKKLTGGGTLINDLPVLSPDKLKNMVDNGENIVVQIAFDTLGDNSIFDQLESLGVENHIESEKIMNFENFTEINEELTPKIKEFGINPLYRTPTVNNMRQDVVNVLSNNENGVIICNVSKTGDNTLFKTFDKINVKREFVHHSPEALNIEELNVKNKPIKIITAVREPIGREISALFQRISFMTISSIHSYDKELFVDGGDIQKSFEELTENNIGSYSQVPSFLERFSENILDVMSEPFDKEKGCTIIKKGNVEVFVYTLEKMNDIIPEMSEFVGVHFDEWVMGNVGADKWIAKSYKQAQEELVFSQEFFDSMYNEPYVKHFYTDEQIEKFKSRWQKNVK